MHDLTHLLHKVPLLAAQLITAGKGGYERGAEIRPHLHLPWELVYVLEGSIRYVADDGVIEAGPGTVVLTPPRTIHHETCPTAWMCYYLLIDVGAEHPWPRVYHDDANQTFANLCGTLVREWCGREPERDEMLDLLLAQCDLLLQRRHAQRQLSSAERLVREVERCLEERFMERITIKDLTAAVDMSPSYVRGQFTRLRGITPMAYLQALRVQRALTLIRTSSLGLEAIANACGYDSASHLSRHVKRATGKSPGTFRYEHADY